MREGRVRERLQNGIYYIPSTYMERYVYNFVSFLSPRNSVGGDIVTRPFVGGWVSEWVSGFVSGWVGECVRGSVPLYLVDTIATTVFGQSLSNFTYTFAMMRGGTLLIMGHGVKGQGQL